MKRGTLKTVRQVALAPGAGAIPVGPLPGDAELAANFGCNPTLPRFNALQCNHDYTGSWSAVQRFVLHLKAEGAARATTIH
ncbi:hypothetical protein [Paraburkholderia sp. MM6662-R1]|uniref:hypothetical protein n=1 Tax=Paraburkholderia sp. MM6662-R1 TaxID=2991066 RepID=UPI003D230F83